MKNRWILLELNFFYYFFCWERKICVFAPWKTWKQGEIPCRNFEVWDESLNTRRNEPNKMAEAIGGQQRIHKLAQLLVFFEVRLSSFHRHSEGGNNIKEQNKQAVSQISNCHFYYCLFMGVRKEGPWTGPYSSPCTKSVGMSVDRRSVFSGHPVNLSLNQLK